jgi:hypothetical protein
MVLYVLTLKGMPPPQHVPRFSIYDLVNSTQ